MLHKQTEINFHTKATLDSQVSKGEKSWRDHLTCLIARQQSLRNRLTTGSIQREGAGAQAQAFPTDHTPS